MGDQRQQRLFLHVWTSAPDNMILLRGFGNFVLQIRPALVKEGVERALGEVLDDKLLGDGSCFSEAEELFEYDWFLHLGAHVPPVQRGTTGVLEPRNMIEMKQCEECVINYWEGVQYF